MFFFKFHMFFRMFFLLMFFICFLFYFHVLFQFVSTTTLLYCIYIDTMLLYRTYIEFQITFCWHSLSVHIVVGRVDDGIGVVGVVGGRGCCKA